MPEIFDSPEPSAATAAFLKSPHRLLIDGQWLDCASGERIAVVNPASGEQLASVAAAGAADVDLAVRAARRAFDNGPWRSMGASQRSALMNRLADLLEQNSPLLTEVEVLNNGMSLSRAGSQAVPRAAQALRYFAGWTSKIHGDTLVSEPLPVPGVQRFSMTRKEPLGVVAQIVPWNFPLAMMVMKLAPALAAGCTVVVKPDEHTPLTALLFAQLAQEAGFPAGVINMLPGVGEVAGAALSQHPDVDKVSFTGSTEVGKKIVDSAKGNLKRVMLELGGKSPFIVFPDADMNRAVAQAVFMGFFLQGQNCVCPSRMFVHCDVLDTFVSGLVAGAEQLHIGPGLNPRTDLGPLIDERQLERVLNYVAIAKSEGAQLLTGGEQLERAGNFMRPTVFVADNSMRIAREEIFGPVLSVIPFDDVDEVLRQANDTEYGLAGSVWTRDISTALRVSERIKAGVIGINTHGMPDINAAFGGYKQSGWGREMGAAAVESYLETKTVLVHY